MDELEKYKKCNEIRELFRTTILQVSKTRGPRFREWQIFVEVLGEGEANRVFLGYLHDVSTCPPEVILWCRRQINTHLSVVK